MPKIKNLRAVKCFLFIRPGYRSRCPGFDSRLYQIIWEVVGLKRGPLSLVNTIEELLGRNSSGFGLEYRKCSLRDPLRWPRNALYPQKLALISWTSGGRSVGTVRLRTKATEVPPPSVLLGIRCTWDSERNNRKERFKLCCEFCGLHLSLMKSPMVAG
jgi:hypothetical protein